MAVEVVLIILGVIVVLLILAALGVRSAVRRAGRRLGPKWREAQNNLLPPGPRRDAALLRQRLAAELRDTSAMLDQAPEGVVFRADAAALLHELTSTGTQLDKELAAVERFRNPAQQRAALDTLTGQVHQLIETSYSARQTVLRTSAEDRSRSLDALRDNVATQAHSLENYQRQRRGPGL